MPPKNKLIRGQRKLIDEQKCVEVLREIKGILDEAEVKYWLDLGTLLGAVRDGKFIPWDNDIDLGTMYTESWKIIAQIPEFERRGFTVDMTDNGLGIITEQVPISMIFYWLKEDNAWRLCITVNPKFHKITQYSRRLADRILGRNLASRTKMRYLRMKIAFALIPSFADNTIRKFLFSVFKWLGGKYCAFVIPKSYYEDLDSISFYDMTCSIPSRVHDYLSLYYGENWRIPDQKWAYPQYSAIDYNFDIGKREELSIFKYLKELKK
jgi:phosphorylcholine metabolism protein LicD